MPLTADQRAVPEKTNAKYTAVLKDEDDVAVGTPTVTALTLTLYNDADGAIINSRDGQDVLNTNNCTLDSSGNLVWNIQPADTTIQDTTLRTGAVEKHVAIFTFTYGGKTGRHRMELDVEQWLKVV